MEVFQSINVSIPLWEIVVLGIVAVLSLLSSKFKLGLMATFVFVFYWGFVWHYSRQGITVTHFQPFDAFYLFGAFCIFMGILLCLIFIPSD